MRHESRLSQRRSALRQRGALLSDRLDRGLVAGQVGTVVQSLADDHFEVEFSGDDGRAYAMAAIPARELIVLHYAPVTA